jgi:hypothetical protein
MYEIVLYGMGGGLAIEVLYWWSKRETFDNGLPSYAKNYAYWVTTLVMVFLSGGLIWVYHRSGIELKPIVAFNLGASTPSILAAFTKAAPPKISIG